MATKQNKSKEAQLTTNSILDRLIDGRVIDTGEMYDRFVLSQQLEVLIGVPPKRSPNRIR